MDGIFGVGLPEMMIIALVLFIIGGPENTTKWAREMGRTVRKLRQAWDEMISEVERELGPDGKELIDATRELGRNAQDLRNMSSPRRLMTESSRQVQKALTDIDDIRETTPSAKSNGQVKTPDNDAKYQAWLPPEDKKE